MWLVSLLRFLILISISNNIINRSKGDYAYTLLDLDETDKSKIDELVAKFEASDNIVRVRLIKGK